MNRLVIDNLEFCQNNEIEQHQVKGAQSNMEKLLEINFGSAGLFVFDPTGEAAAGAAAVFTLAIGGNEITSVDIGFLL